MIEVVFQSVRHLQAANRLRNAGFAVVVACFVCAVVSGPSALAAPGFSANSSRIVAGETLVLEAQFLGRNNGLPGFRNGGGNLFKKPPVKGLGRLKLGKPKFQAPPKFGNSNKGRGLNKFGKAFKSQKGNKIGNALKGGKGNRFGNVRKGGQGNKFGNVLKGGKGNKFGNLLNGGKGTGGRGSTGKGGNGIPGFADKGNGIRPPKWPGRGIVGIPAGRIIQDVVNNGGKGGGEPPCNKRLGGGCGPSIVPESGKDGNGIAIATGVLGAVGALVGTVTNGDHDRCPRGTMGRYPDCRPVHDDDDDCWNGRCGGGSDTTSYDPPTVGLPIPPIPLPPSGGGSTGTTAMPTGPSGPSTPPPVQQATVPPPPARPTTGQPPVPAPVATAEPDQRPNEVIVIIEGTSSERPQQVAQRYRLESLESARNGLLDATVQRFRIPDQRSVDDVLGEMRGDQRLAAIQPNYLYRLRGNGSAKGASGMAGMQYALSKLRLEEAHALSTGERTVLAVIDSAVDVAHPEFVGRLSGSYDAVGTKEPGDTDKGPDAHGTAIAGIIAARGQLVGVAPSATVLAARAFFNEPGSSGPLTTSFILLKALDWAHDQNSRIYNLSFAGPRDPAVSKAIAKVHAEGGVLLAAAGNAGPQAPEAYPAAYSEVIAITATDSTDHLYSSANRGGYVAIAAPGVDIIAPVPGAGYDYKSGTSFATAHVSGLVALMLERDPDLTADQIRDRLLESAVDLGPKGRDPEFGAGRVDAYGTIEALSAGLGRQAAR